MVHLAGKTLVPGLTDLHVHLTGDPGGDFWKEAVEPDEWGVIVGAKNALITAKAGFTTVRDVGSAREVGVVLRRGTAEGLIPGPRILSSGPALSIIGEEQRAQDLMERLLRVASPLGLFAEEFDVETGRHLGNFPQAFSHLALIEAAARIIAAERASELT